MDERTQSRDKLANDNKVCHMLTSRICSFTTCSDQMWLVMLASDLFCILSRVISSVFYFVFSLGRF